MFIGWLECDVLISPMAPVHSLKHKRAVLRPVLARLRRLEVAVSETEHPDLHQRAGIGVATVGGSAGAVDQLLDRCERQLAAEVELELLSVRRRLVSSTDVP